MNIKMPPRKSGLGKGLDSMIPDKVSSKSQDRSEKKSISNSELFVKIDKVEPNKDQPRKNFDEDALNELAESIRQFGVLQPLLVQKKNDFYEIIAGERRWRAAKIAGVKEVPVIVKEYSNQEIVEISLIENIQRENLNPIEEAVAYKRLLEEFHLKQDEVAERVSKSRAAVTNAMRLLKLDERVQQMLINEMISSGHARALLSIEDGDFQYELAQEIFDKKLSVREVEKMVKKAQQEKENPQQDRDRQENDPADIHYQSVADQLKERLGTKVTITQKNGKGKIEIDYYSLEEFERITELLQK
jgi:ParB family chromosome partitioning protein